MPSYAHRESREADATVTGKGWVRIVGGTDEREQGHRSPEAQEEESQQQTTD